MADLLGHEAPPRRARLPRDWSPTPESRQFAIGLGLDPDAIAPMFRDYWQATGKPMLDWKAAWQVWCRREAQRKPSYPHHNSVNRTASATPHEPWEARMRGYRPGGFWSPMWGPRPGQPGCFVPREILEQWKARQ